MCKELSKETLTMEEQIIKLLGNKCLILVKGSIFGSAPVFGTPFLVKNHCLILEDNSTIRIDSIISIQTQ